VGLGTHKVSIFNYAMLGFLFCLDYFAGGDDKDDRNDHFKRAHKVLLKFPSSAVFKTA
jgi:hypothetical protein